ncbi:proline dehydrogenase [Candidatus Marinamargulisbacteria bacterium SCGC AG-439-L15]|nr:proline dehydrogenase [Candidatus Marinamargulisbacteria bacterium SCGC AG-439-L15]
MNIYQELEKIRGYLTLSKKYKLTPEEKVKGAIELSELILEMAQNIQTDKDSKIEHKRATLVQNPDAKVFLTSLTDRLFRTNSPTRLVTEIKDIINETGIPKGFSQVEKLKLKGFQCFAPLFPKKSIHAIKKTIRKEVGDFIIPIRFNHLNKTIDELLRKGIRVNLNHLGEAILGEKTAEERLEQYIKTLERSNVYAISVKLSALYSQFHLLNRKEATDVLQNRLGQLYQAAKRHPHLSETGEKTPKIVYLDMESFDDLHFTISIFQDVLSQNQFMDVSAGIALQAYIPDSFMIQKELTEWALKRVDNGGSPIRLRIVKGANLAYEQVQSSISNWKLPIYSSKTEVDANFKRMIHFGCQPAHSQAVSLGIGTHNVFDIAYTLLERAENHVEKNVSFEMLYGMSESVRKVIQMVVDEVLVYCPTAENEHIEHAMAYLIRRFDEQTHPENFLAHSFNLKKGSTFWQKEVKSFSSACERIETLPAEAIYCQSLLRENDTTPATNFAIPENYHWAEGIINEFEDKTYDKIPLGIGLSYSKRGLKQENGEDPSIPKKDLYSYELLPESLVNDVLDNSKSNEKSWQKVGTEKRAALLRKVADNFKKNRTQLIGLMIADTGKLLEEADKEVSEAIDFLYYYSERALALETQDVKINAKGTALVCSPWNFPCAIPTGCIASALVTGNVVLFKPAAEATLVGWQLAYYFWEAGISQEVLKFIPCNENRVGNALIKDTRIDLAMLTGGSQTARHFLSLRPDLDLIGETGGKNTMIISATADRDQAIKDICASAFSYSGQKCSATSLVICEKEIYEDIDFRNQLKDAVESLKAGSAWSLGTKVGPLIKEPSVTLRRGLTHLDPGETWLVPPHQDGNNPKLWTPGIKLNTSPDSFSYQNELFGPIISLLPAQNLDHAIDLANQTPYGLCAGLQTLSEKEKRKWINGVNAGNYYINRPTTHAIVGRQPFGGIKSSNYGRGLKAGGPHYLQQLVHLSNKQSPKISGDIDKSLIPVYNSVMPLLEEYEKGLFQETLVSYSKAQETLNSKSDPHKVLGEDNYSYFVPCQNIIYRALPKDSLLEQALVIAAGIISKSPFEISVGRLRDLKMPVGQIKKINKKLFITEENQSSLIERLQEVPDVRLRLLQKPSTKFYKECNGVSAHIIADPLLYHGESECSRYQYEITVSAQYHRYGNLGNRNTTKQTEKTLSHT